MKQQIAIHKYTGERYHILDESKQYWFLIHPTGRQTWEDKDLYRVQSLRATHIRRVNRRIIYTVVAVAAALMVTVGLYIYSRIK